MDAGMLVRQQVGKKALAAVSGGVVAGWLLLHAAGNLQVFAGAAVVNGYARLLRQAPLLLWGQRAVLLLALSTHVTMVAQLAAASWRARPERYRVGGKATASLASRSMRITGPLLAVFVVWHLMEFTVGNVHPAFVEGDVAGNLQAAFSRPWAVLLYEAAAGLVAFHLWHGGRAALSSLGLHHPVHVEKVAAVVRTLCVVLVAGLALVPVGVALGWAG